LRIDDGNRLPYELPKPSSRKGAMPSTDATDKQAAATEPNRLESLQKLKQAMTDSKPIDVNQLADSMLKKGVFFDSRA